MWRIKALADPAGVLAPGVLLNRDPGSAPAQPEVDAADRGGGRHCVECGFCEPVCPSRDLTTTPRQRIVLRREMARQAPGSPITRALLDEYEYDGLETCAVDGTCMLACPLGIDTGRLVKELRAAPAHNRARSASRSSRGPPLGRSGACRACGSAPRCDAVARRDARCLRTRGQP